MDSKNRAKKLKVANIMYRVTTIEWTPCSNFVLYASFLNFAAIFGVKSTQTNIWDLSFSPWTLVQYTIIQK